MKKCMKVFAMVLVLALALSMTAVAASPGDKPTITPTPGASVAFTDETCTILNASFTNAAIQNGKDYIVWVIAATKDGDNTVYIPTQSSILYIGQATASGTTFTFNGVYPKEIADGAVMISGPGLMDIDTADGSKDGLYTLATIKIPYTLGDVNDSGEVDINDLTRLARYMVDSTVEINMQAADVTRNGEVDINDLTRLARYMVGGADLG